MSNEGRVGRGLILRSGLVLAIEPTLLAGGCDGYRHDCDGWTLRTQTAAAPPTPDWAGAFLAARVTAHSLRSADIPVDVGKPDWQDELLTEVGEACEN